MSPRLSGVGRGGLSGGRDLSRRHSAATSLGDKAVVRPRQPDVLAQRRPSYFVRNRPRRCNSGTTSSTNSFKPAGSTCGMMLKPSAAPPRYHSSSASAMSAAGAERDAMAARGRHPLVELADGQVLGARHLHHHLLAALLGVGQRHVGHRPVERDTARGRCRRCPTAPARRARDGSAPEACRIFPAPRPGSARPPSARPA